MSKYNISKLTGADSTSVYAAIVATYGSIHEVTVDSVRCRINSKLALGNFEWFRVEDTLTNRTVAIASALERQQNCYDVRIRLFNGVRLVPDLSTDIDSFIRTQHQPDSFVGYVVFGDESVGWF